MKKPAVRTAAALLGFVFVALFLAGCTAGEGASAGRFDWPRWRGPNGDGISRETGWNPKALEGGPRVAWKANVGAGFSGVVIRDNRLYAMGSIVTDSGFINCYCLDAATGKELWRYSTPGFLTPQSTPVVDGSSVYCLSKDGILFCLDSGNGNLRWKKNLVVEDGAVQPYYGFAGAPVIVGNLLILTANTSGMALDKNSGERAWVSEMPPAMPKNLMSTGTEYHSPSIYLKNEKPYALVCSWKGLFSVEVETGKRLLLFDWEDSYPSSGGQVADPVIVQGRILVVGYQMQNRRSFLLNVQGKEGEVLWKSAGTFSELGSPVFFNGYLYVSQGGGDGKGSLRCLDPKTGKVKWEEGLAGGKGQDSVSFVVAGGKLIVLNDRGVLSIAEASPRGFRVISSGDVLLGEKLPRKFWTPPVLCNGRIYCRNFAGELVCIDVRK